MHWSAHPAESEIVKYEFKQNISEIEVMVLFAKQIWIWFDEMHFAQIYLEIK